MTREEFFDVNGLSKGLLCTGAPGNGKSNFGLSLFLQLLRHGVPTTFIEGANTQARTLKSMAKGTSRPLREALQDVRVYTTGNGTVNLARLNPFRSIPGVPMATSLGTLREWFEAAFPAHPPLPQLCAEAAEEMLLNCGTIGFSIADLRPQFRRALRRKGYSREVESNVMGAFDARMIDITRGSLGITLCSGEGNLHVEKFFDHSRIIEMNGFTEYEIGVFLFILLGQFRDYVRFHPPERTGLRHAFILDEAHNIVGTSADARGDVSFADPKAYTTRLVCRMLAEFRAMENAVCLFDQSTAQISELVRKSTCTKIAFRQGDEEDRETMGSDLLLDGPEKDELGRLQVGEAYVWTDGYHRAQKIQTPRIEEVLKICNRQMMENFRRS